jgi:hypothetical protein
MSSRNMSLLPRATLHSDSEQEQSHLIKKSQKAHMAYVVGGGEEEVYIHVYFHRTITFPTFRFTELLFTFTKVN